MGYKKDGSQAGGKVSALEHVAKSKSNQRQRAFGSMATTMNQRAGRPSLITRGG